MGKEKYLISVIIPVYNTEKYLKKCVDSVREQTYSNIEILLVDDGSTDGSYTLCMQYEKKDSRIRVFQKENGGLMSAWIHGVKASKGEYLCFVDSDDWIDSEMIESLSKEIKGLDKEVICSNYVIEKEDKGQSIKVTQGIAPGSYDRKQITENLYQEFLGNENRIIHYSRCMKLISRNLILSNLKFTDERITMGEDMNIMLPSFLDAERITVLEQGYFYHYRFVNSSMVHKYNPNLNEKVTILYQALQRIIVEKAGEDIQKMLLERLKKEYLFLMLLVMKNELRGPKEQFTKRIRKIIQEVKEKELRDTRVEVRTNSNKLLYQLWKTPNNITISTARAAIWLFDQQ